MNKNFRMNLDPKSKEVATIQELDMETEPTEWNDDLEELFGRIMTEESDDMDCPFEPLDFNETR